MTVEESVSPLYPEWKLYIDGASRAQGSVAGIILIGPRKMKIKYAVQIKYNATNHATEYEALLSGPFDHRQNQISFMKNSLET